MNEEMAKEAHEILNEMTREDLITIDNALVMLARYEYEATHDTKQANQATHAINRIARRLNLISEVLA
jgi:uncharacterized membrane protein